jgi:stage II sporulation protein AA (anti-sigma F factor antagonist)
MSPSQPPFAVREVAADSGVQIFEVEGELDLSTAETLGQALGGTRGKVVVDLTACPFIDSTGLALLLRTAQRLERDSGSLGLVSVDPEIRRLLHITGLDMTIAVHPTRDEAIAAVGADA